MATPEETAAAAAAEAARVAAAAKSWHETAGVAPEMVGLWTNKGWDTKDPGKIAVEVTKSYQAAEALIGAPAAQLLRLPADMKDATAMRAVYQKLGVPMDAKDYDLAPLKGADGKVLDQRLDDTLRAALLKANVPASGAAEVAASMLKYINDGKAAGDADVAAALVTAKEKLASNWGDKAATNMVIAQNAATALGFTKEQIDGLEKIVGYDGIMEKLRDIGTRIGEAKFLQPNNAGGNQIASRDQAQARLNELKKDTQWNERLLNSDSATVKEFNDLSKLAFDPDKL